MFRTSCRCLTNLMTPAGISSRSLWCGRNKATIRGLGNDHTVNRETQMYSADDTLAGRAMQRELGDVISSDEKLMEDLRVYREVEKPVRQRRKRRGSRRFTRFLVAICLGIAGTLAWQSYGDATIRMIATRAPDLGWSPEAKQMIASSIQWLGWTKTSPDPETTAVETVAPKVSTAPSLDSAQVQQMVQSLAALREMVQQLTAVQDQTTRETAKLESAVAEILTKMPEPQAQPPAAPARKPAPATRPSLRAPIASSSPPAIPPKQ
jgi:hypothetical protein